MPLFNTSEFRTAFDVDVQPNPRTAEERENEIALAVACAKEVREHAWLARMRCGDANMSDFVAKEIARYVDALIGQVLTIEKRSGE